MVGLCEIVRILYANGISRRAGLCSAQGSSVHRAIAPEETLDPIAGAETISQISWIRKILEIATELKTAHLGKCSTHDFVVNFLSAYA